MISIFDRDPLTGTTEETLLFGLTEDELLFGKSDDFLVVEESSSKILDYDTFNLLTVVNTSSNPVLPIVTNPTDLGIPTRFDNKKIIGLNNVNAFSSLLEEKFPSGSNGDDFPMTGNSDLISTSDQESLFATTKTSNNLPEEVESTDTLQKSLLEPPTHPLLIPPLPIPLVPIPLLPVFYTFDFSNGINGINSRGLKLPDDKTELTGKDIGIGQLELSRPGKPGFDVNGNFVNTIVKPEAVFYRNGKAKANTHEVDDHAVQVAGVMIAQNNPGTNKGVATNAKLYSGGLYRYDELFFNGPLVLENVPDEAQISLALQNIALENKGDVRAINLSFGSSRGRGDRDGSTLFTQFVDWSAREHDVLYVVAGNEGEGGITIPSDEFNGITVAATEVYKGRFSKVASYNNFADTEDAHGPRTSVDLVAPGTDLLLPSLGNKLAIESGTSYAAPHVTGTVALLQEFGDVLIADKKPGWDLDARRHEVMKAVLMNSADKRKGILEMEKTIVKQDGSSDWLDADLFRTDKKKIPLDEELGTGQLNAKRALKQFENGESGYDGKESWGELTKVSAIGWDYGTTTGKDSVRRYLFDEPLKNGSYVSITLAWDRKVTLNDFGLDKKPGTKDAGEGDGLFSKNETFKSLPLDKSLTNLDLYLLDENQTKLALNKDASISEVDSVEHIFFQIPKEGKYKFVVHQKDSPLGAQSYGVAWWTAPAPPKPKVNFLEPNFQVNENGIVVGLEATLVRTGNTSGASTVNVVLSDGTATSDADYSRYTQTIFFAANQTRATITIPITDSTLVENAANLTLKLIDHNDGTEIGSQSIASLFMLANDTLIGGNPGDTIVGGYPGDTLIGGDFNDTLTGTSRDEILAGGDSIDPLIEGSNNSDFTDVSSYDTLVGGSNDTVYLSFGQDTYFSSTYGINTASLSVAGVSSNVLPYKEMQFLNLAPAGALPSLT